MYPLPPLDRRHVALLSLIILATACADVPEAAEPDPLVSTESPSESMTDADYGELEPSDVGLAVPWTTNTVSRDAAPEDEPVRLTDVTTARSRGYDRVVFSFSPELPGYRLALSTETGGGCDGDAAASDAAAHLAVEFEPALSNEGGTPLVTDRSHETGFPALVDAAQACDQDNRVRWLLGASGSIAFRIMELRGDPRLVVDLRHP